MLRKRFPPGILQTHEQAHQVQVPEELSWDREVSNELSGLPGLDCVREWAPWIIKNNFPFIPICADCGLWVQES